MMQFMSVIGLQKCFIGKTLETLESPYKEALRNLVDVSFRQGGLGDFDLAIVMQDSGLSVSQATINRHRRNVCGCRRVK